MVIDQCPTHYGWVRLGVATACKDRTMHPLDRGQTCYYPSYRVPNVIKVIASRPLKKRKLKKILSYVMYKRSEILDVYTRVVYIFLSRLFHSLFQCASSDLVFVYSPSPRRLFNYLFINSYIVIVIVNIYRPMPSFPSQCFLFLVSSSPI